MKKYSYVIFSFAIFVLSSAVFAGACADSCQKDYDKWNGPNGIDTNKYNSKSYYCGYSDTNCWSRQGTPSGQPDPCWKMCSAPECSPWSKCNDAFQSCCLESSRINSQNSLDQCIAACPKENKWGDSEGFATCEGNVKVTKCDGTDASDFSTGVVVTTGKESGAILSWNTSAGSETSVIVCPLAQAQFASSEHGSIRGTINGGGDFVQCVLPSQKAVAAPKSAAKSDIMLSSEHGSIRGTCNGGGDFIMPHVNSNEATFNLEGTQNAINSEGTFNLEGTIVKITSLSSEHGSIRGTCNGGGDFIMPDIYKSAGTINFAEKRFIMTSNPNQVLLADTPVSNWSNGRISVFSQSGAPSIVLAYALPTGIFEITSKTGSVGYVVDMVNGSAKVLVNSGSIVETEVSTGTAKEVLQGGSGQIGKWEKPAENSGNNYVVPPPNQTGNSSSNSNSKSNNGTNKEPGLCGPAVILGLLCALALFVRKK